MEYAYLKRMIAERRIKLKVYRLLDKNDFTQIRSNFLPVFNRKGVYMINREICWIEDGKGNARMIPHVWLRSFMNDINDQLNQKVNTKIRDLYELYVGSTRLGHNKNLYRERLNKHRMNLIAKRLDREVERIRESIACLR